MASILQGAALTHTLYRRPILGNIYIKHFHKTISLFNARDV